MGDALQARTRTMKARRPSVGRPPSERGVAPRAPALTAVVVALTAACRPARAADPAPAPMAITQTSDGAAAPASERQRLSLQGGWWVMAAEWRTRPGIVLSLGIPWVAVPLSLLGGATWVVPLDARAGYALPISGAWSLRGSAHAAFTLDNETSKCGCQSDATKHTFVFAEVGLRYDAPGGFVAGVDIPVLAVRLPRHWFHQPEPLAFSQAYVGYAWDL